MCMRNYEPVSGSPCCGCPDYLCTCMPIVMNGFIYGECDTDYCCYCPDYSDCEAMWGGVSR